MLRHKSENYGDNGGLALTTGYEKAKNSFVKVKM
jgi:hypothetical protein